MEGIADQKISGKYTWLFRQKFKRHPDKKKRRLKLKEPADERTIRREILKNFFQLIISFRTRVSRPIKVDF